MSDLLIVIFLIATPGWFIFQFTRMRPVLDAKERAVDPLTGAVYTSAQQRAHEGMSSTSR